MNSLSLIRTNRSLFPDYTPESPDVIFTFLRAGRKFFQILKSRARVFESNVIVQNRTNTQTSTRTVHAIRVRPTVAIGVGTIPDHGSKTIPAFNIGKSL